LKRCQYGQFYSKEISIEGEDDTMSVMRRGRIFWCDFWWNKRRYQLSTLQTDKREAAKVEAAFKGKLLRGEPLKQEAMLTLRQFISERVEPWARNTFGRTSPQTLRRWYVPNLKAIREYDALAMRPLDGITSEHVAGFAAHRLAGGLQISSVNSTLRVLRRCLGLAAEWGLLPAVPKVRLLKGEKSRDRVVSPAEEQLYLAAAPEPLCSVVTVLLDTGLRIGEALALEWRHIHFANGRSGAIQITSGKSPAAQRMIPMTARCRSTLERLYLEPCRPERGQVWQIASETLRRMHLDTLARARVKHFVLHSVRHTFLTRLGASGCDAWTLAKIAGHSNIRVSAHYVHPQESALEAALLRLNPLSPNIAPDPQLPFEAETRTVQ
jgi:integrase